VIETMVCLFFNKRSYNTHHTQSCICRGVGGLNPPPAKISDPPLLLLKKRKGGVDFLCTYALARSSTSRAKTSTPPLMKFDKYSPDHTYTPLHVGKRSIAMTVSVCLSVYQRAYLGNYTSGLYRYLCTLPMAVARSSSGGVAIRYVLPVLWFIIRLHRMRNGSD